MKIAFLRFQRQKSLIAMLYLTSKYCRFFSLRNLLIHSQAMKLVKLKIPNFRTFFK